MYHWYISISPRVRKNDLDTYKQPKITSEMQWSKEVTARESFVPLHLLSSKIALFSINTQWKEKKSQSETNSL